MMRELYRVKSNVKRYHIGLHKKYTALGVAGFAISGVIKPYHKAATYLNSVDNINFCMNAWPQPMAQGWWISEGPPCQGNVVWV